MRCVKRREHVAAQYAETKFYADTISLVFLLNKKYTPFFKWMHRAVKDLPILGGAAYKTILESVLAHDYNKKYRLIEEICASIITEFKKQGLSEAGSSFLLDHGPVIQAKIKDPKLREMNVWMG
jgi:hypothetical protein